MPLDTLDGFENPAVSRYSATSPALLKWYSYLNERKSYDEQVKPFNFLLSFQYSNLRLRKATYPSEPKPVSPFDSDHKKALKECFDRVGGEPIGISELKTYREMLLTYHLHPEDKFEDGDYVDSGTTVRRHVVATQSEHIGKEANRWEEQLFLGCDPEAQVIYGISAGELDRTAKELLRESRRYSRRKLAEASDLSVRHLSRILSGQSKPTELALTRLLSGLKIINLRGRLDIN